MQGVVRTALAKKAHMVATAGKDTDLKVMERIAMTSMSVPAMMDSAVKHVLLYKAHQEVW